MVAEEKIRAVIETLSAEVAQLAEKDRGIVGLPSPLTFDGFAGFLTTNGRHDLFFSAASALEKVRCPTLAIIGSKDLQVSPKLAGGQPNPRSGTSQTAAERAISHQSGGVPRP